MRKIVVGVLGATLLVATVAVAQPAVDAVVFGQGRQVYQDHCALCHEDAGTGNPPAFAALSGNDQLGDPGLIVSTIRRGAGAMPPFPDLSAAEISAVATYIRNAWANGFGAMTTADATAALEGFETAGDRASVWDGVFTEAQAARGRALYPGACGLCHGRRLNGAPDDPDMPSTPPLARGAVPPYLGREIAGHAVRIHAGDDAAGQSRLSRRRRVRRCHRLHALGRRDAGGRGRAPTRSATSRPRRLRTTALAACGKTPAAFDRRCIPPELRCSSVTYWEYAPSSRLVSRAPRRSRCYAGFYHRLLSLWQNRRCIYAEAVGAGGPGDAELLGRAGGALVARRRQVLVAPRMPPDLLDMDEEQIEVSHRKTMH